MAMLAAKHIPIYYCCMKHYIYHIMVMSGPCYTIAMSADERKEAVRQAVANEKLEGLKISPSTRRTMDQYASGELSAKEAAEQVYRRYGVKNAE